MKKLFTLLFYVTATVAAAQAPYSLDDCIRLALENNVQIRNSHLDEKATDYRIKEVRSALLPSVDVNSQYLYYLQLPTQYAPASAFGGPEGQYRKMTLAMQQNMSSTAVLTQTIFNKSVVTSLQAARVAQETTHISAELTREEVLYSVTATYYTIQVLRDNLVRLEDNIVNLEKTVSVNESLKNAELVSDNIYNRLLINLENLRNQYQNQELAQQKNISLLKVLLNVEPDAPFGIAPFDYSETLEELAVSDISRRPDIHLQESQIKLSQYEKKSIAAGYFPVMVSNLSYGFTSYNDEFAPHHRINNDWINSSYFSLSAKIPLFDGFHKRYQIRQKDVTIRKHINTLSLMRSDAEKELRDAVDNYHTNKKLVVSTKTSLDLAERLFTSAQSEYASGIIPVTELLNAQSDLSNARTNYSTALLNLKLAELSLRKANGTLTQHYNDNTHLK